MLAYKLKFHSSLWIFIWKRFFFTKNVAFIYLWDCNMVSWRFEWEFFFKAFIFRTLNKQCMYLIEALLEHLNTFIQKVAFLLRIEDGNDPGVDLGFWVYKSVTWKGKTFMMESAHFLDTIDKLICQNLESLFQLSLTGSHFKESLSFNLEINLYPSLKFWA